MIMLTAPNGTPVWVDPKSITIVRPNDNSMSVKSKTVVIVGGTSQGVIEAVDKVISMIKAAG